MIPIRFDKKFIIYLTDNIARALLFNDLISFIRAPKANVSLKTPEVDQGWYVDYA